jgi:hypothetical protein
MRKSVLFYEFIFEYFSLKTRGAKRSGGSRDYVLRKIMPLFLWFENLYSEGNFAVNKLENVLILIIPENENIRTGSKT